MQINGTNAPELSNLCQLIARCHIKTSLRQQGFCNKNGSLNCLCMFDLEHVNPAVEVSSYGLTMLKNISCFGVMNVHM